MYIVNNENDKWDLDYSLYSKGVILAITFKLLQYNNFY